VLVNQHLLNWLRLQLWVC